MHIVIAENLPSRCMDDLKIFYFDSYEEAKTFLDYSIEVAGSPTRFYIYEERLSKDAGSDIFNYT